MRQQRRQRQLFEDPPAAPAVNLPPSVREELRRALVQWIEALAQTIGKEQSDE